MKHCLRPRSIFISNYICARGARRIAEKNEKFCWTPEQVLCDNGKPAPKSNRSPNSCFNYENTTHYLSLYSRVRVGFASASSASGTSAARSRGYESGCSGAHESGSRGAAATCHKSAAGGASAASGTTRSSGTTASSRPTWSAGRGDQSSSSWCNKSCGSSCDEPCCSRYSKSRRACRFFGW